MTRTAAIMASYDNGASNQPLLGETVGENFTRMAMTHADREPLVDRFTGRRWTYAELIRLGISHHKIVNNAHLTGEILGYTELDRICVPVSCRWREADRYRARSPIAWRIRCSAAVTWVALAADTSPRP
jgi:hypothetical protein